MSSVASFNAANGSHLAAHPTLPCPSRQVNACLDLIDKGDNIDNPEPSVVVIEGAHGTGKVSYILQRTPHGVTSSEQGI